MERPALPASVAVKGRGADAVRAVTATALEVGRLNRVLVASALVGVLAVLSFTVSAGGLGVVDAARAVPQQLPRPTDGPVSPSPSSGESAEPTDAPSRAPTEEPSAEASAAPPSFQPLPSASP